MRGDTRLCSVFQSFCFVFQGQEPIWLCMALLVVWGKGCIDAWARLLYCGVCGCHLGTWAMPQGGCGVGGALELRFFCISHDVNQCCCACPTKPAE